MYHQRTKTKENSITIRNTHSITSQQNSFDSKGKQTKSNNFNSKHERNTSPSPSKSQKKEKKKLGLGFERKPHRGESRDGFQVKFESKLGIDLHSSQIHTKVVKCADI